MKKRTMFLLWIGAAISISEIFTGGLLAPLGLAKGLAAIVIGHVIGAGLLGLGGYVAFSRGQTAMESVAWSLGRGGGKAVALLNVIQLIGWTIVMIVQAGSAVVGVFPGFPFAAAALVLAVPVLAWALLLGSPAGWLNDIVVVLLGVLCAVLFAQAMVGGGGAPLSGGGMTMALAVELSIAMPVSWLPLVGDYSSGAPDRLTAAVMPAAGYLTGSVLMYAFGLFIGVVTGGDIFAFIASSPLRWPAFGVVLLSTVTTAFLDLYSAAVSSGQLIPVRNRRVPVLIIGLLAAAVAVLFPAERYEAFLTGFLTAIGMVFVPVFGVVFLDYLHKRPACGRALHLPGVLAALAGMLAYRLCDAYGVGIPTLAGLLAVYAVYTAAGALKR